MRRLVCVSVCTFVHVYTYRMTYNKVNVCVYDGVRYITIIRTRTYAQGESSRRQSLWICTSVCVCVCVCVCMYACVHVHVCGCTCVGVRVHTTTQKGDTSACMCMCV